MVINSMPLEARQVSDMTKSGEGVVEAELHWGTCVGHRGVTIIKLHLTLVTRNTGLELPYLLIF